MGKLIYAMLASLDGYVVDANGSFEWAEPDEEVHAYANDLERPIGTHLYGRRMYDVMRYWASAPTDESQPAVMRDYTQIWQAADNVVYSTTLDAVTTPRTRLERSFDSDAVRALKRDAAMDISIGGPGLAEAALRAGLVDECHLIVMPVVVGGGTSWLPPGLRLDLELLGERRFSGGAVDLHYAVSPPSSG